ncbi:MAG TPA: rRNA maturation RNase YbeY [Gammaproteobacteria bacterium]|nr:rRNA maturation RNase YbeY [Gammaproteobacteria bacterium]
MTETGLELDVQYASRVQGLPQASALRSWARAALAGRESGAELVIRIVDEPEGRELNARYRGKDDPTNVLSFPFEAPPGVESAHLGDLVLCAPVVVREAKEQGKPEPHHWAHLVIHGVLHLLGYDHHDEDEAVLMERRECELLRGFGIPDPYRSTDHVAQG